MLLFSFSDPATTEIYTLSLHDALPIWHHVGQGVLGHERPGVDEPPARDVDRAVADEQPQRRGLRLAPADRKSTCLNSSHSQISYAVFCLKKKKKKTKQASNTQKNYIGQ